MAADGQAANDRYEVVIVKYGTRSTVKSDVFLNYHVYGEPDLNADGIQDMEGPKVHG